MHRLLAVEAHLNAPPVQQHAAYRGEQHILQTAHTAADDSQVSSPPHTDNGSRSLLSLSRSTSTFPVRLLINYLDGGAHITELKELVSASISSDPVFVSPYHHDQTRAQQRAASMQKIRQCVEMVRSSKAEAKETATAATSPTAATATDSTDMSSSRAGVGRAFEDAFFSYLSLFDPSWSIRMGVHYGLFAGAVNSAGDEQQRAEYDRDIREMRIIGSFGMTEMGHGSNVAGIETTATFQPKIQDEAHWILHSPTLTATKWWIGGVAHMATHCAVYARLMIHSHDYGVHCFIVQLRDRVTGEVQPGITLGDMGLKMGKNGLDNGWLRFAHKRLPLRALLMRAASVDADGVYTLQTKNETKHTAYGALLQTRGELFNSTSLVLQKAATIAIRYAASRRQGVMKKPYRLGERLAAAAGGGQEEREQETLLLDYHHLQHRLFPIIAHAFALTFTAKHVLSLTDLATQARPQSHNPTTNSNTTSTSAAVLDSQASLLAAAHATSAGLKALGTWYTYTAIETCRQSLGGNGYSAYTGLAELLNEFAVMCTWEGDNTVLSLQCARYLLKQYFSQLSTQTFRSHTYHPHQTNPHNKHIHLHTGTEQPPSIFIHYITEQAYLPNTQPWTRDCFLSTHTQVQLYQWRVQQMLRSLTGRSSPIQSSLPPNSNTIDIDAILTTQSIACIALSHAHCQYYMLVCFLAAIEAAPIEIRKLLQQQCHLFALSNMYTHIGEWLQFAALPSTPCSAGIQQQQQPALLTCMPILTTVLAELLAEIRPNAVALVDSFNLPDWVLSSAVGHYDDDMYQSLFDRVKQAAKITTGNAGEQDDDDAAVINVIPEYWQQSIRPLTDPNYSIQ